MKKFTENLEFEREPISAHKENPIKTVCKFRDLPDEICDSVWDSIYEGNRDQDLYPHTVGFYVDEFESASDPENYPEDDVNTFRILRDFLIENGCVLGEEIFLSR